MLTKTVSGSEKNAFKNNHSFECAFLASACLATLITFLSPRSYFFLLGFSVLLVERIVTYIHRCYSFYDRDSVGLSVV